MTLTEFLLARIAEDEELLEREDRVYGGGGEVWTINAHNRVRAECEAKRRIVKVEVLHYCDNVPRDGFVSHEVADQVRGRADTVILRALAAVYADHEDYRDEWKP